MILVTTIRILRTTYEEIHHLTGIPTLRLTEVEETLLTTTLAEIHLDIVDLEEEIPEEMVETIQIVIHHQEEDHPVEEEEEEMTLPTTTVRMMIPTPNTVHNDLEDVVAWLTRIELASTLPSIDLEASMIRSHMRIIPITVTRFRATPQSTIRTSDTTSYL